jgi:hypothetical protein
MSSRPKSLSGEAAQFYKSGQPFLQHNLPFWMASLVGHLLVLLIPIVAVLYPMMRFPAAQFVWSSGADYGVFEGDDCDAFVKDLPLDRLAADVLIAFEMNGSPLRPENGYPVRLGPISPIA